MTGFWAFTKKELCESVRTYKLFIMGIVFLLLGILNPLTAKLMPDLMDSLLPPGMVLNLAEPTAMDSWAQFFKNVPQIGLIVMVILASGMMAGELSRGTLINMVTKGLSRSSVVAAKFLVTLLVFTLSFALCFAVSWAYTVYFWSDGASHLFFSVFCLWLFGALLIAVLTFGSVLFRNVYGPLLLTGGFTVLLFIAGIFPNLQKYNPLRLASDNTTLLTGSVSPADFGPAIGISCALAAVFLAGAIALFNKKVL